MSRVIFCTSPIKICVVASHWNRFCEAELRGNVVRTVENHLHFNKDSFKIYTLILMSFDPYFVYNGRIRLGLSCFTISTVKY